MKLQSAILTSTRYMVFVTVCRCATNSLHFTVKPAPIFANIAGKTLLGVVRFFASAIQLRGKMLGLRAWRWAFEYIDTFDQPGRIGGRQQPDIGPQCWNAHSPEISA
jgi:hypothetical protein